ncbi:uncharacterized protein LOC135377659 isoform X2 [Ornithodoros turicata]|uniref:uncharacterized protein LOC135377659 isoform X2 n=1 Tax=Ornithodoros turicata TaxID=34597 RepID=UPI003138B6EC
MESFAASALPSKYATAFSFPLCYTTSDTNSDSEASTSTSTSRTSEERSVVDSKYTTFVDSCSKVVSEAHFLKCIATPSLQPPPKFGKLVTTEGLLATVKAMHNLNLQEEDSCEAVGAEIVRAATAPAVRPQFTQSSCTSAISSFSSESLPVLLTSSQSQESTDYESSQLDSDLADMDRSPWVEEASDRSNSSSSFPRNEEVLSGTSNNSMVAAKTKKTGDFSEDNLVNNSELTVSLESVLTVVPLPQAPDAHIAPEHSQLDSLQFGEKPRHSTSSFGDISIQSWDSHLESDPVIDDIVENVIHDLTLHDRELKTWGGILHLDGSHTSERKASPASMSSYASSRRLEWDNGADIGYTKVSNQTSYNGQSVAIPALNVGKILLQSEMEDPDHKDSTCHELLQKDKGCSTCPKHFNNAVSPVTLSSCDVTVQTDMACKKDAEVQAQPALPKPSLQERLEQPLHVTDSVCELNNGTSSSTCSTTLSHCTSLLNDDCGLSSVNSEKLCLSNRGANLEKHALTRDSKASMKQDDSRDNSKVLKDCARSVELCYSQKFSREFENYISEKGHTTGLLNFEMGGASRSKSSVDSAGYINSISNGLPVRGRRGSSRFVPVTHLESISSSHLKMQIPMRLGSLTSGTDSPAEMPRSSSEINKRRLDYWLNCGFPYVPSVAPLKAETRGDTLPKVRDACHVPRVNQSPSTDTRAFPQLLKISSSCVEAPKVHLSEQPLPPTHVPTRKRYVTRCRTSHVSERESLCTSDGSRSIPASTKETPKEVMVQVCKSTATQNVQRLQSQVPLKPGCAATVPFVIRERSGRCIAKPRKGRNRLLALSNVSDGSEIAESSEEQPSFDKQIGSESGSCNGGAKLSRLSAFPDTSSSASSCNSRSGQCYLRRVARRELDKLRMLVDKQRHSYLRRLQREVNRLQKLEALFVNEREKHNAPLPHTAPVTRNLPSSTIPSSQSPRTHSSNCGVSKARTSNPYIKAFSQPERYFVTIAASPKKPKRQLQPSKMTGVSWVVPLLRSGGSQKENASAEVEERVHQLKSFSLQAAFAEKCKHVIRHSQDRLSRITALAERRSKRRAIFPAVSREPKATTLRRSDSHKLEGESHPRALYTQREMRQQTEKVYNKLPEVVQMKEKLSREQQYRRNRQTVQTYNKAIQEHALRGCVNFAIDRPCINI